MGEPGAGGRRIGRGGGSFRGERVVGGRGAEIESREAGRGLVNRTPASPSVTFGFFGLRVFLGGVLGRGVREAAGEPEYRNKLRNDPRAKDYL